MYILSSYVSKTLNIIIIMVLNIKYIVNIKKKSNENHILLVFEMLTNIFYIIILLKQIFRF